MSGTQTKTNTDTRIVINREPSFYEVWREGYVEYSGQKYYFWLIDPQRSDYEPEVRWFFNNVPVVVRAMYTFIIESYKKEPHDDAPAKPNN